MIKNNKSGIVVNYTNNFSILKVNNFYLIVNNLSERSFTALMFNTKKNYTYLIGPAAECSKNNQTTINLNGSTHPKEGFSTTHTLPVKSFLEKKIRWTFLKFKYHGKGYKVKKYGTLGKLTMRFGKSHWTKILYENKKIIINRTKKNVYCVVSFAKTYTQHWGVVLKRVKGVSKYTKRGVRLARQKVSKRFGKVSQASSLYK